MDGHRLIRLEARDMADVTIVVRASGVAKYRLKFALLLMRIAGRVGGFKSIKMARNSEER